MLTAPDFLVLSRLLPVFICVPESVWVWIAEMLQACEELHVVLSAAMGGDLASLKQP